VHLTQAHAITNKIKWTLGFSGIEEEEHGEAEAQSLKK